VLVLAGIFRRQIVIHHGLRISAVERDKKSAGRCQTKMLATPLRVVGLGHEQPVPIFQQLARGRVSQRSPALRLRQPDACLAIRRSRDVGGISKCGDRRMRTLPYEAANVMLTRCKGQLKLKDWAFAIARRSTMRKARVALARRLAIIMHAMLRNETEFAPA
jgi:hypothetical protein